MSGAGDGLAEVLVDVSPESAGWGFSGLRVVRLGAGGQWRCATGPDEVVVVPLAGSFAVVADEWRADLAGRESVFAGPSDVAYVPRDAELSVSSERGGRFAVAAARARRRLPFRHVPAAGVPVELRGAGTASRQVHNFATPQTLDADRLIACEVLTPSGNWSSYPPHKHDEERPGESALEEIYSCRTAGTGRRWPRPATTCTTSTSWPGRVPGRGSPATTPTTPGCAAPGPARPSTHGSRSEECGHETDRRTGDRAFPRRPAQRA
jgi:5-deoxy-D-glucuronate isomerase